MAEETSSGKFFNGYTVGSGASNSRSGVEYMNSQTLEVLDMLHSSGISANNTRQFGDYGLEQSARPRDSFEYGGPLEGLLEDLEPANNNTDFQAGVQYAVNAIFGSASKVANNNPYALVPINQRAPVNRGYGSAIAANNNNYNTSSREDSTARPFGDLERMMSGLANMPRGSALEFTEVRRSLRIVRF